jgi:ABC-2 type transport system permease protein
MNALSDMLWIESRKALRSRMPLFTTVGCLFMPLGIAFLIFVATHPEVSRKLGLVSAKANLMAYAATDWPAYLGLTAQIIAAGGFFLFCLILCWVFGREFVDGALKDLLAVPVPRGSILLAKFIVAAAWSAALAVVIFTASLLTGALIGLPGGSFAFFASVGRGYLLPIGVAILALIMANLVVVMGWGEYFPWAVPGLFAQGQGYLLPISYGIAVLTGLAGMGATYLWWKYADQSR